MAYSKPIGDTSRLNCSYDCFRVNHIVPNDIAPVTSPVMIPAM